MKIYKLIIKNKYFPKYSKWIFIFSVIIISLIYNYQEIIFKPPQSLHQWRQSDCLSITFNYYQEDNPLFEPSIHNLGMDGTGKTVSDFPLIYYSISKLWKIFGQHEYIYRLIILIFFFSGLFALFKIFENKLKDSILAIISSLFLFTSPTLVYYANNFLMDIPAFSLALIGLFFFFKFTQSSSNIHLFFFALFYTIAGLLKISSLISFMAIFSIFILEILNIKINAAGKIFKYPKKQFIIFISILLITGIWYIYANYYNATYNAGFFLIGVLPIWDLNTTEIKATLNAVNEHIKWDYLRRETQIIFFLMFLSVIIFFRRMNKMMLILTFLVFLGVLSFVILFFQALKDHDYYVINLFILIPIVFLSFLNLLKSKLDRIYFSLILKVVLIAFLIHNIDFARRRIEDRYSINSWQNKDYIENIKAYENINSYLHTIGINKDDRVICLSDNSINITLYTMNRKGWTNYNISRGSNGIEDKINQGAKYLFINKNKKYKELNIQSYINKKIGEFNKIEIYSLNKLSDKN